MRKGASITAKYYVALFDKLKQQLFSKHRGKLSKGILFLQNNPPLHMAAIRHQKWSDLRFDVLKHPVCSPDLAPSNYCLFPNFKKQLGEKR
jgi:histone-lysine N-methyltransferase SETMAR